MDESCELDEGELLEYVLGIAPAAVQTAVARSPSCQAAAQQLARTIVPLSAALYRSICPDAATLVAYQERALRDSTQQLMIRSHLADCTACQEEIALLTRIDAIPLSAPVAPLRRVVEALFQSPLAQAQPARGGALRYQTEQVAIHLLVRARTAQRWSVRGQLRDRDGQPLAATIASAWLQRATASEADVLSATLQQDGLFQIDDVAAGVYTLHLLTDDEQIVVRDLPVGYD